MSHLALIERVVAYVCRRNHLSPADADDFHSHVTLKLLEDDYAILAKFEGRSSLQTYLSVVLQRMFLDYRIAAWGKWRPSAEAKRLGPVAILLEQLTTRDGYAVEEACELLSTNHGVDASRQELEQLMARLPPRSPKRFESDDVLVNLPSDAPAADRLVADREAADAGRRLADALRGAMAGLETQDRLVLTMRFEDGRTVAEIAATLRLDQKALYRRIERLLASVRVSLEAQGIQRAAVLEMLETPAVSTEWGRGAEESVMASPSMTQGAR